MTATGTEARVCQDIADRQAKGIAKYGTTVEGNPLGVVQWIQHAYEECLDQAVYLRRCLEVLEGFPIEVKGGGSAGWSGSMAEAAVLAQSTTLEDGSILTASKPEWTGQSWMTDKDVSPPLGELPQWTPWYGGECPVELGSFVEVKYIGGGYSKGLSSLFDWGWGEHVMPKIKLYRVVK